MRNNFSGDRKFSLFNVVFVIVAIMMVVSAFFSIRILAETDCSNGFWVRDAMGMPRCIKNPNIGVLVH